jgi:hypothetical protein
MKRFMTLIPMFLVAGMSMFAQAGISNDNSLIVGMSVRCIED